MNKKPIFHDSDNMPVVEKIIENSTTEKASSITAGLLYNVIR